MSEYSTGVAGMPSLSLESPSFYLAGVFNSISLAGAVMVAQLLTVLRLYSSDAFL